MIDYICANKKEEMTTFETLLQDAPQYVKELMEGLKGLRENPEYHPEKNVALHLEIVVNRLLDTKDIDLIVSGFLHDLFKLKCMVINKKGQPSSPYHEVEIADYIRRSNEVQGFIVRQGANVETVLFICENHMRVKRLGEMRDSKRWALMKHELFPKLTLFTLADKMSNDWKACLAKLNGGEEKLDLMIGDVSLRWLLQEHDRMLAYQAMGLTKEHTITGKDLIRLGFPEGKVIGMAIKVADEKLSELRVGNVFEMFRRLALAPADFVEDEALGEVAQYMISIQEKV